MILNKKYLLLLLTFYCVIPAIQVSGQSKTFEATYGGTANDIGNFVQQTLDGGYIICGAKGVPGSIGYYDFYLIKISPYGTVQWTNSFGDSLYDEQAQCVRQMFDGTYIIYGTHSGSSDATAWLVKADEAGNIKWGVQQEGSASGRFGYSIVLAQDGGYQTASFDNVPGGANHFQLQKTDSYGQLEWGPENVVKGIGLNSSLALANDDNYISVGTTDVSYDAVHQNYYSMITLVKMNNTGGLIWSKSYLANPSNNASNYLQGYGVQATEDGGYIICGSTTVNAHGGTDIFLLKTDANGDSLWSKSYGGYANDVALSVKEVPGGGYALSGNTRSFGNGSTDIFILRTSAAGDSLWMRTFGGSGFETAGNIEVTADAGFVVVGTTNSFGAGQGDVLILRTDSEGRIPDASIQSSGVNTNICSGSNLTLNAKAGYSYLWSNGATTQGITVNQAGNYSVTVKDNYENMNLSKVIPVGIDHPITSASFTVGGPTTFCANSPVILTADSISGYIYQWQVNGSDINIGNARQYAAAEDGDYRVVIANACNSLASSEVTLYALPAPATPAITMVGKNLVSSSNGFNQWYRNGTLIPGAVNAVFTPTLNGTYTVAVGSENHCTAVSLPVILNAVGVEENKIAGTYLLYPNPANDIVYIDFEVKTSSANYFVIFNAEGKEVYREKLVSEKGFLNFATGELASGLYFSGIETQGAFAGRKVLAIVHR